MRPHTPQSPKPSQFNTTHQFLTRHEVADRYRVSNRTVEGWHDRGIGPESIRVGGRRLYTIAALAKFEQITGF